MLPACYGAIEAHSNLQALILELCCECLKTGVLRRCLCFGADSYLMQVCVLDCHRQYQQTGWFSSSRHRDGDCQVEGWCGGCANEAVQRMHSMITLAVQSSPSLRQQYSMTLTQIDNRHLAQIQKFLSLRLRVMAEGCKDTDKCSRWIT